MEGCPAKESGQLYFSRRPSYLGFLYCT